MKGYGLPDFFIQVYAYAWVMVTIAAESEVLREDNTIHYIVPSFVRELIDLHVKPIFTHFMTFCSVIFVTFSNFQKKILCIHL